MFSSIPIEKIVHEIPKTAYYDSLKSSQLAKSEQLSYDNNDTVINDAPEDGTKSNSISSHINDDC